MFLEYYGLREQPFGVTPDPRYLYFSASHREALASLFYGIETGCAFLALIAQPGMGKTTLLSHLIEQLRSSAQTVFLFQTQCTSREFFRYLLADLGIDASDQNLARMHESLNSLLLKNARTRRRFVLVIDEAQTLDDSVLELVRLLSNFETSHEKLLQVVLSGQPQLADKLSDPGLTQLRQRISIISQLHPLTRMDAMIYVEHRLHVAGHAGPPLFRYEAIREIVAQSGGIPRVINNICFNALTLAYAKRKPQVDGSIVREVLSDLDLERLRTRRQQLVRTSQASFALFDAGEPTDEASYKEFHEAFRIMRTLETQRKAGEENTGSDTILELSGNESTPLSAVSQCDAIMPATEESAPRKDPISAEGLAASFESNVGSCTPETVSPPIDPPQVSLKKTPKPEESSAPAEVPMDGPKLTAERSGFKPNAPGPKVPYNGDWKPAPSNSAQLAASPITPPAARKGSSKEKEQQESLLSAKSNCVGSSVGRARDLLRAMSPIRRFGHETSDKSRFPNSGTRFLVISVIIFIIAAVFLFAERHGRFLQATDDAATGLTEPAKLNSASAPVMTKGSGKDSNVMSSQESTRQDAASDKSMLVTIKEGQTLSGLAVRYQGRFDSYLTQEILKLNPQIANPDLIITGTQIRLPRPTPRSSGSDSSLVGSPPRHVRQVQ